MGSSASASLSDFSQSLARLSHDYISSPRGEELEAARAALAEAVKQFAEICEGLVANAGMEGRVVAAVPGSPADERCELARELKQFTGWTSEILKAPPDRLAENAAVLNEIRVMTTNMLLSRLERVGKAQDDDGSLRLMSHLILMLSMAVAQSCVLPAEKAAVTPPGPAQAVISPVADGSDHHAFANIIENLGHGVAWFDEDFVARMFNKEFLRLMRLEDGAYEIGDSFEKLIRIQGALGEYGSENIEEHIQERLRLVHRLEHQVFERVRDNGQVIRITVHPIENAGFVSVFSDISDQIIKDEEVRDKSNLLDLILDNVKHGVAWYDKNLILRAFNKRFHELGNPSDDPIQVGESLEKVLRYRAECGNLGEGDIEQIIEDNMALNRRFEFRVREMHNDDGTIVRVESHPIPGGGMVSLYADVTEEKAKDREIREKSHLLDLIMNNVKHGVAWYDENLILRAFNSKFHALGNTSRMDEPMAIGDSLEKALRARAKRGEYGPGDIEEHVQRLLRLNQEFEYRVFDRVNEDGTAVKVETHPIPGGGLLAVYSDVTDDLAREQELKEKSRCLDLILHNVNQGIVLFDKHEKLIVANTRLAILIGCDEDTFEPGLGLDEFSARNAAFNIPQVRQFYDEGRFGKTGNDAPPEALEFECAREKGATLRVEARPLTDGGWVITYADITALKQRAQAVEEQKQILETIFDNLNHGVSLTDAEHRVTAYNKQSLEMFDIPPDAVRPGDHFIEFAKHYPSVRKLVKEGGQPAFDKWLEEALKSEGNCVRLDMDDGRTIDVHRVPTPAGSMVRIYMDMTEILDREGKLKGLAQDLEAANSQTAGLLRDFEELVENMDFGVAYLNADLSPAIVNRAFRDIWSINEDTVEQASSFEEILREIGKYHGLGGANGKLEGGIKGQMAAIASGNVPAGEIQLVNGRVIRHACMALDDGRRLLTYYDLTELKEHERALEEARRAAEAASRAKSEFLANMSHEIRTPMNGVLGMAEILSRTPLDNRQINCVDVISKSGSALIAIINDILDFSKFEAGKLELDLSPFHLRQMIEDVAALMAGSVDEKNLELIVRIKPGLPERVVGDAGRLRQIITNLVGNAVKFTDKGYVLIDVDGEVEGDTVALKFNVKDTGVGIEEGKLRRIFDKFEQADNSSTRQYGGTGLGLAITKRLLDLMGGEIDVSSNPERGSKFWFTLNLPIDAGARTKARERSELNGLSALVVDDIELNQHILVEHLESRHMRAASVSSGEAALEALHDAKRRGSPFDLVVLDYQMPGMDGAELARRISQDPEIGDARLVMLTSVGQQGEAGRMRDVGISGFLVKPARAAALFDMIADVMAGDAGEGRDMPADGDAGEADPAAIPGLAPQAPEAGEPPRDIPRAPMPAPAPAAAPQPQIRQRVFLDEPDPEVMARPGAMPLPSDLPPPAPVIANVADTDIPDTPLITRPTSGPGPGEGKARVLLAEDNEVNQRVVEQMLIGTRYELEIAEDGAVAVEKFKDHRYDLVLMDVSMPEMDGYEATRAIRADEQENGLKETPIIALTAHVLDNDRQRCIDAGMNDYLPKPIDMDVLQEVLAAWLKKSASSGGS